MFLIEIGVGLLCMAIFWTFTLIQKARFKSRHDPEHYIMKLPGIITAVLFGVFILLCYGTVACFRFMLQGEFGSVGFTACLILALGFGVALLWVIRWKIVVTYDAVTVYSLFKKPRTVKFNDISVKIKFDLNTAVYANGEKLFTLRESTIGYETFCERLRELGKMS